MFYDQLNCVKKLTVDFSYCQYKCEGIDIISYTDFEVNSKWDSFYPKVHKLNKNILKLSDQYNKFKEAYDFPSKFKSMGLYFTYNQFLILDYQYDSKLHYIKIYFGTPKYDKITKVRYGFEFC